MATSQGPFRAVGPVSAGHPGAMLASKVGGRGLRLPCVCTQLAKAAATIAVPPSRKMAGCGTSKNVGTRQTTMPTVTRKLRRHQNRDQRLRVSMAWIMPRRWLQLGDGAGFSLARQPSHAAHQRHGSSGLRVDTSTTDV